MTDAKDLAKDIVTRATSVGVMVATAESCTGGLVAGALTEIAGSSAVVDRGFVTYSNAAKMALLGVEPVTLETDGAVSDRTAQEMAQGALANSLAQIAVSITGIAGPGGGSEEKPVGLVWFGLAVQGQKIRTKKMLFGDIGRSQVRAKSVETALRLIAEGLV